MFSSQLEDEDEEYFKELDATSMFKQDADRLTTVQNLEDGLSRFGFTKDDKISRRELVNIYNQIKNAMEPEIFRLANSGKYAEAKEMRLRFTSIRQEFDGLQLNAAAKSRQEQNELFDKAQYELIKQVQKGQTDETINLEKTFASETSTHFLYQSIQTTNLEQQLTKIHRPNVRYSKRLIELFKAEYNLNKLKQYDEAIKVRRMINRLQPLEAQRFHQSFDQLLETKRDQLKIKQEFESNRLDEKLKSLEWKEIRRKELETRT
jgi:hypothetical protein